MRGVKLIKMFYNSSDSEVVRLQNSNRKNYLILRGPSFTLITKKEKFFKQFEKEKIFLMN